MTLGIFARTFPRPTVEEVFDAVAAHGLRSVQFNFSCAGLPTLAEDHPPPLLERIRGAAGARGLGFAAVSGTWNMIHPDPAERAAGLRRLPALLRAARTLGAPLVTLCTGTRDPHNMWRAHPANDTPEAWNDLLAILEPALEAATAHGIALGLEPETGNVVNSALKARRLLDQLRCPALGIVLDGANLLRPGDQPRQRAVLSEAFDLLGRDVVLAHAKDWAGEGPSDSIRIGDGLLDWEHYLALLRQTRCHGPLILHGFDEAGAAASVEFLRGKLAADA